jgi:tetratricopeptide (TPR) repeat protein
VPLLDEERAVALDNLGIVRHDTGDLAEALRLHLDAAAIFRRLKLGRDLATAYHNAGSVYVTLRRPEAEGFLERALEIRRDNGDKVELGTTLAELGLLRLAQARTGDAESLLREALQAYEEGGLSDHDSRVLKASGNLIQARSKVEDEAAALAAQLDALATGRICLPENHPDLIGLMLAPTATLLALDRLDEATALAVEAVELARRVLPEVHDVRADALHLLTAVHLRAGRMTEASAVLRQVAPVDDQLLARSAAIGVERLRRLNAFATSVHTSALLAAVREHFLGDPAMVRTAFESLVRRKGLLQETETLGRWAATATNDPVVLGLLARLSSLRRELARRTIRGPRTHGTKAAYALQRDLQALASQRDRTEADIAAALPTEELVVDVQPVTAPAIAEALPERSALVEYTRYEHPPGEARYLAFVLPAGAAAHVRCTDLGEAEVVETLVGRVLAGLRSGEATRGANGAIPGPPAMGIDDEAGEALRARVLDPLVASLDGCTRLVVAPDAALYSVPLDVLPDGSGGRIVDRYCVSYVDTGRDVLRFRRAATTPGPPAVIAAPDYDLGSHVSSPQFEPLDETGAEAIQVARRLGVTPIVGSDATEAAVRALVAPGVLHLATHGFFIQNPLRADDHPQTVTVRFMSVGPGPTAPDLAEWAALEDPLLRCGLALAGANVVFAGVDAETTTDDGLLIGHDIAELDLRGTQLVVASTCESGLGDQVGAEGWYGLRRAFAIAGASTMVMSLWRVDDVVTRRLMERFYDGLRDGLGCAEALRVAERAISSCAGAGAWGAFVCFGDPGRISLQQISTEQEEENECQNRT